MFRLITNTELKNIVRTNLMRETWQPIVVLGAPGSGKSYFAKHTLREMYADHIGLTKDDIGFVCIKPAERDGVEIAGVALPMQEDDAPFTEFTVSPVIRKIEKTGLAHGVLLIDEIAQAGIPEQKVLSSLLDGQENSLGDTRLPAGWIVYATGNRAQDKSGALKLLSHNINRAKFFELKRDTTAWITDFAIPHGVHPILLECVMAYADSGWFADSVPMDQESYCTERSLTEASADLHAIFNSLEFVGTLPIWAEAMLAGNIGNVNARRVSEWIARRDTVPTGAEIMSNPATARVPDNTGFQLIAANLAFGEVNNSRTATAALHYLMRLRADLQITLGCKLMSIAAHQGWIITDPAASAFIQQHHEYLPLAAGK
jgi:hypothetical protein